MDQQINIKQNIQAITLCVYDKQFVITSHHKKANINKKLVIERIPGKIQQIPLESEIEGKIIQKTSFSVFLGIMTIMQRVLLIFGEHCRLICSIEGQDIFELQSIQLIPFEDTQSQSTLMDSFIELQPDSKNNNDENKIDEYIQGLKKLLSAGYYFSYGYDLSLSKIKQSQQSETQSQYLWNFSLFSNLLNRDIDERWLTPLIQGFVGQISTYINSKKLAYIVISRRSKERAGTRYSHRGIDDEGNVANFVETEQIIFYNGYCMSHLQIRGSVPTFWQQVGVTAQSKILRNYDLTNNAFIKHFDNLTQHYSRILCVNLMGRSKKNEQLVTETFEKHVQRNSLDNVKYEYFDFHHACKGQQFHKVNPLIYKLEHLNKIFRFYVEDIEKSTVILTQKGIIRSNCLDCLDRTNFFMTKMAAITFEQMLKQFDIDLKQIFNGETIMQQLDNNNLKTNHPFIIAFKNMWADNGDTISNHYTGTGSTHTNVTRTGKRDIKGLLDHGKKTLGRFYMQNFEDSFKQQLIDVWLGNHLQTKNIFDIQLQKELKNRQREFCNYQMITVHNVSWHTHHYTPSANFDIEELIGSTSLPDLIVISLQGVTTDDKHKWQQVFDKSINNHSSILKPQQKPHNALHIQYEYELLTMIYIANPLFTRIKNINDTTVKLNMLNKQGAIVISLTLDDSDICIINCILDSGQKDMSTRLHQLKNIHNQAFQQQKIGITQQPMIGKHNYRMLMGHVNMKLRLPDYEVRQYLDSYKIKDNLNNPTRTDTLDYLYKQDEWTSIQEQDRLLNKYKEYPISFLPTDKHEQYSKAYSGQTSPSYAQRIFIASDTNSHYILDHYQSLQLLQSISRPVICKLQIEIKKVDQHAKTNLTKQIYEVLNIYQLINCCFQGYTKEIYDEDNQQDNFALRKQMSFVQEYNE